MRFMNFKSTTSRDFLHEARIILEIPNAHFLLRGSRSAVEKGAGSRGKEDKRQKKNGKLPTVINLCRFRSLMLTNKLSLQTSVNAMGRGNWDVIC